MKITDVKLKILEDPQHSAASGHEIAQVAGLRRIQYTHRGRSGATAERNVRQHFVEVYTDEGLMGRCTTTMNAHQVDIVRYHAVGCSPWEREALFQ